MSESLGSNHIESNVEATKKSHESAERAYQDPQENKMNALVKVCDMFVNECYSNDEFTNEEYFTQFPEGNLDEAGNPEFADTRQEVLGELKRFEYNLVGIEQIIDSMTFTGENGTQRVTIDPRVDGPMDIEIGWGSSLGKIIQLYTYLSNNENPFSSYSDFHDKIDGKIGDDSKKEIQQFQQRDM